MAPDELFVANQAWAERIARSWSRSKRVPLDFRDNMINSALIGLWEAACRWDGKSCAFATFAHRRILGAMMNEIRLNANGVAPENLTSVSAEMGADRTADRLVADEILELAGLRLTLRQLYVLTEAAAGKRHSEIAAEMGVSRQRVSQIALALKFKMKAHLN